MKKRLPATLIEVIVSLGLLAFLLSSLFFWYHALTVQKRILNEMKWPCYEEKYCLQRLNKVVPKISTPLLCRLPDECEFLFDHGINRTPQLSAKILGKLYYDDQSKTLRFTIWPHPENGRTPSETTTLIDKVERCHFEFYCPPTLEKKAVDPDGVHQLHPKTGQWQNHWYPEFNERPAFIKLTLEREDKRVVEFIFDLEKTILYPAEDKHV